MEETKTTPVEIDSPVYGRIQVQADQIYQFPRPLIGIDDYREYAFIRMEDTPFFILHALQSEFHLILIPAADLFHDYAFDLPSPTVELLQVEDAQEVVPFLVVNIVGEEVFVNMRAPVLFVPHRKLGCQHIVTDKDYPIRHKIFGKESG